jgi:hypothetical protein
MLWTLGSRTCYALLDICFAAASVLLLLLLWPTTQFTTSRRPVQLTQKQYGNGFESVAGAISTFWRL